MVTPQPEIIIVLIGRGDRTDRITVTYDRSSRILTVGIVIKGGELLDYVRQRSPRLRDAREYTFLTMGDLVALVGRLGLPEEAAHKIAERIPPYHMLI